MTVGLVVRGYVVVGRNLLCEALLHTSLGELVIDTLLFQVLLGALVPVCRLDHDMAHFVEDAGLFHQRANIVDDKSKLLIAIYDSHFAVLISVEVDLAIRIAVDRDTFLTRMLSGLPAAWQLLIELHVSSAALVI